MEQPTKKIYLIHWLKEGRTPLGEAFIQYLKSKDYNLEFIERFASESIPKLQEYIDEIRTLKPDLIYVYSTVALLEVAGRYDAVDPKKHITEIPIIGVAHSAPVDNKIVKKIGVPSGRNVTGIGQYISPQTLFNVMKSYTLPVKKIAAIRSLEANSIATTQELEDFGKQNGFDVQTFVYKMNNRQIILETLDDMVVSILNEKPDVIFVPSDGVTRGRIKEIVASFVKHKDIHAAPLFTTVEKMINEDKSCTFALFMSYHMMGLMAGLQAEQILFQGKKITEISYEVGSEMVLAIRQDTMHALKTYPLFSFLETAEVIKMNIN